MPIDQVQDGTGTLVDPDRFVATSRRADGCRERPDRADRMGLAGVVGPWSRSPGSIGEQTHQVYLDVLRRWMLST